MICCRGQSTFSNVNRSASMRDRSRMSLISSSSALPFLWIPARNSRCSW